MRAAFVLAALGTASLSASVHVGCMEDGVALVQQRAASQAGLQASPSGSALPNPGEDGITMTRISASCAVGNALKMSIEPFCIDEDACGGPRQCVAYYGQIVNTSFSVHLESGIQPGDTVSTSYSVDMDYNGSDFFSNFLAMVLPKRMDVMGACQYCTGSCVRKVVNDVFKLNLTVPTTVNTPEICGNGAVPKDLSLSTEDLAFLMAPPTGLKPTGNVTFGLAIKDSSGDDRVAAAYRFDMLKSPPKMYEVEPTGTLSLLYSAWSVVHSSVADALELVRSKGPSAMSLASRRVPAKSEHGLIFNLTVADLENGDGDNISLSFSHGCNKTDDHGSISCLIPPQKGVELLAAMKLAFHADEGSTFSLKVKVHIGGDFGMLVESLIPGVDYTVPLCGTEPSNVTAFGVPSTYVPSRCGNYVIELANVVPFLLKMEDFENFMIPDLPFMPFLPKDLDEIMPITCSIEMDLKHHDSSRIGMFNIDVGLGVV